MPSYLSAAQISSATSASTLTLSGFAAGAGSNRFLEVWVGTGSGSPAQPTGVTWGGQALTQRGTGTTVATFNFCKWFLKEANFPGGATGDIVATWAAAHDERAILAMVCQDVDQTNPYRNASQASENDVTTNTPSITVSSDAADLVTGGIWCGEAGPDITAIANTAGTERADTGPIGGGFEIGSASTVAGSSPTLTYSVSIGAGTVDNNIMMADSLQAAAGGGGSVLFAKRRLWFFNDRYF